MAEKNAAEEAQVVDPGEAEAKQRERSTIEFPYGDLDDAVQVAKAVNDVGGTTATMEQLAAQLGNMAISGGGFRVKTGSAKTFGLVRYSQGAATLTQLGIRICDSKHEAGAKAQAFLEVPLFKRIFETFKGVALPPTEALEAEMVNLGVARKQKERARQTFQRSAQQAGFFWSGANRLVMPKASSGAGAPADGSSAIADEEEARQETPTKKKRDDDGSAGRHPFIAGLLKELPAEGAEWTTEERRKWLQAAAMIFDIIYKNGGSGKALRIEVESAK